MTERIIHGDCLEVMRAMDADSIDAIVTDPPYGLSFMGKHWDHGVPGVAFWDAALRVAKPGTYLLAFGGTRTYHRMACAIEDAGWEIHDCLCWLYGSGFPKHKSKLKPAYEPIVMARKPAPRATPLNIDACRIEGPPSGLKPYTRNVGQRESQAANHLHVTFTDHPAGRWPANVCCDEDAAAAIDAQSGERRGMASQRDFVLTPGTTGGQTYGKGIGRIEPGEREGYNDTGGASRFFYCAKSSRREREAGLDGFAARQVNHIAQAKTNGSGNLQNGTGLVTPTRNHHPTVKPVALMRWLVRLVTPIGGTVLDPFAGSGTTGIAAVQEDRSFIGIENEKDYVPITDARIRRVADQGSLFRPVE